MQPVRSLDPNSSTLRDERFCTGGMLLVRLFVCRLRTVSVVRFPSELGIEPDS